MKNGVIASESSVSCGLSRSMAMMVLMVIATFEVIDEAVSVTTAWTPPTSFARRLWISPVRVAVKNRNGSRCRCAYSALRRSCMTFWPMTLLR